MYNNVLESLSDGSPAVQQEDYFCLHLWWYRFISLEVYEYIS